MLSAKDNEMLTRTGAGTPMGDLFRRFWVPVAAVAGTARARLSAAAGQGDGRGPDRLSRYPEPGRPGRAALPASRRQPVLRPQRAWRHPLRLPWLEVRRRRHSVWKCRPWPRNEAYESIRARMRLKSYPTQEAGGFVWAYMGPPERMPELPQMEFMRVAAGATLRVEEAAAMQLGAGLRGRARHRAFLVPAHVGRRGHGGHDEGHQSIRSRGERRQGSRALAQERRHAALHGDRARCRPSARARRAPPIAAISTGASASSCCPVTRSRRMHSRARTITARPSCRSPMSCAGSIATPGTRNGR